MDHSTPPFSLGIDFGTTGARAIAIDRQGRVCAQSDYSFPTPTNRNLAKLWQTALFTLLNRLPVEVRRQVESIAINGTSSTVLLCNGGGYPLDEPILYSDSRGTVVMDEVRAIAPANHTVVSATSSLAKLMWWLRDLGRWGDGERGRWGEWAMPIPYFLHQADWLAFLLHGQLGVTDYHNALKLGYDVATLTYPDWLGAIAELIYLPRVLIPGEAIAPITPENAAQFEFPSQCLIHAGTTDSIAAFLASGVSHPGDAVTSLGSTLVLKLLSQIRVDDARYGIYSHRLGDYWLVGGASNTGGGVLRQFFTPEELTALSAQIDPTRNSGLDYYPLTQPGERFPINDPDYAPRLEPRPDNPVHLLHGLLEGIARIEAKGYSLLHGLGATPLERVYTAGGGAMNEVWSQMRSRLLEVPVFSSPHTDAAYGTALLAQRGIQQFTHPFKA